MAESYEVIAYCLHRRPYRETSYLATFFSAETGKFSAVIRGAQGRSPASLQKQAWLQPFRALQLQWREKSGVPAELVTLQRFEPAGFSREQKHGVVSLQGNAQVCGLYMNELLYRLLYARMPLEYLFEAYHHSLLNLSQLQKNDNAQMGWILRLFEYHLLHEMGVAFECEWDSTGQPIEAQRWYDYIPTVGAVPYLEGVEEGGGDFQKNVSQGILIQGACLEALRTQTYQTACLPALKKLFRHILAGYLGKKPIMARQLFQ